MARITPTSTHALAQPDRAEVAGVDEGDHEDAADVVDDRRGQQEQPQAGRHPPAEQGDDAHHERDVGGDRDGPPGARRRPRGDRQEDEHGHDHAAERGHERQGRSTTVAQLATTSSA
jgi:hypothetical protein